MSMPLEGQTTVYDSPDRNTAPAGSLPSGPGGPGPLAPASPEEAAAWQALLGLRRSRRGNGSGSATHESMVAPHASPAVARLFELYLPLCAPPAARPLVIGHLGQSLDGKIATASGCSRFINGASNILHLHRLRALVDGILVGAGTVAADDPQLTVRLCEGPCPTRIVIDTNRRLGDSHRLFNDGAAPTLVVCAEDLVQPGAARIGRAELIGVPRAGDWIDVQALLAALAGRGLRSLLVEGGGVTVSRFLVAGALSRLQITIAPVIIGSGRPGVVLPAIGRMDEALRPPIRRFEFGDDVLFECIFERP
jgi:diaminohydroxyphosphoribosylaminopyrimidine deaminase / 5-amino-6-(5-phosphoribosylamino)uracil reductase